MEADVRDSMRNYLVNEKKFYQTGRDVRDFRDTLGAEWQCGSE